MQRVTHCCSGSAHALGAAIVRAGRARLPAGRRRVLRARRRPPPRRDRAGRAARVAEQRRGVRRLGGVRLGRRSRARPRDASEALRQADEAMYAQKQSSRASAGREISDVLLQRAGRASPRPRRPHGRRRRARGVQVAERLGVDGEELVHLRHAASLHDIGKVAIPDAIITKAGPAGRRRVGVHPPAHADRRAHRLPPRRRSRRPRSSCAPRTRRGTAAATRMRWPARRSRSAPASSPSAMPSTR